MALLAGVAAAAFTACGCGSVSGEEPKARVAAAAPLPVPETSARSALALLGEHGQVQVGDPISDAFDAFPMPSGGFEFTSLPPRFAKPYTARGWESGRESFGVVAYGGQIVLAMRQIEQANVSRVADLQEQYERAHPRVHTEFVSGAKARYWFWETDAGGESRHRVMLCAVDKGAGAVNIAVAVGDAQVMDLIGASPTSARTGRNPVALAPSLQR